MELISVLTSQFTGKGNISLLKRAHKLEKNEMKVHLVLVVLLSSSRQVSLHAFNKSGRHLEFLIYDVIRGKNSAAIFEF